VTHLDFWIDARLREFEGLWPAVADLADEPDVGAGESAEVALRGALASLGENLEDCLALRGVATGGPLD
jgi:hypothetical protein